MRPEPRIKTGPHSKSPNSKNKKKNRKKKKDSFLVSHQYYFISHLFFLQMQVKYTTVCIDNKLRFWKMFHIFLLLY